MALDPDAGGEWTMTKKGTTTKRDDGKRPRCAICGSPRVIAYQKITEGVELYVCRRIACVNKWRDKVRFYETIHAQIEQEARNGNEE